jgi:hypothetical protein
MTETAPQDTVPPDIRQRQSALAQKMGQCLHGENLFDVAAVCARLIPFALAHGPSPERMLKTLIKDMRRDLKLQLQQRRSRQ